MTRAAWLVVIAATATCGGHEDHPATPGTPDDLATMLRTVAGTDAATRQRVVASWRLDEGAWDRTIVPGFRSLYAEYAARFDDAVVPVIAQLATPGTVTARLHYAGDPRLTHAQQRTRWTLPPLYPSAVAELDGVPLDTVFVYDGMVWRALAGLDAVVLAHVRATDAACADRVARAGPLGTCTDVGYEVAAAALHSDRDAFARACGIAATVCANRSP